MCALIAGLAYSEVFKFPAAILQWGGKYSIVLSRYVCLLSYNIVVQIL